MTYRERRLNKAARLHTWAEKRQAGAAAVFQRHEQYRGDHAFNTQPGHIPERARVIAREDRAYESLAKARTMDARAGEIERQAGAAIYSDDSDAIEQLIARIANLEGERDRKKAINVAIRKGPGWEARIVPALTDGEKDDLIMLARFSGHSKPGYPPYAFQNLSGNIARQKARLAQLQVVAEQRARVVEALAAEQTV